MREARSQNRQNANQEKEQSFSHHILPSPFWDCSRAASSCIRDGVLRRFGYEVKEKCGSVPPAPCVKNYARQRALPTIKHLPLLSRKTLVFKTPKQLSAIRSAHRCGCELSYLMRLGHLKMRLANRNAATYPYSEGNSKFSGQLSRINVSQKLTQSQN